MTLDEALNYCNKTNCNNCVVKLYNLDTRLNNNDILCYENLIQEYKITSKRLRRKKGNEFNKSRKNS